MVFAFGGYLDRTMSWCYGSPSCWEGESQYSPEYHRSRADYPPDGVESIQPPNIGCHQSRLPTLGSQPSELVFPGAIQLRSESKPVVWTCCMNLETFRSFLVWRASLWACLVSFSDQPGCTWAARLQVARPSACTWPVFGYRTHRASLFGDFVWFTAC
jgi:hypothetical protein